MKKLALFPGLDGTGELYYPLLEQLECYECSVILYPHELIEPKEIATYLRQKYDFSEFEIFVAESFGCRVLNEIFSSQSLEQKSLVFIAGFQSIHLRYRYIAKLPDWALKPLYKNAQQESLLNYFCLASTKNRKLLNSLMNVVNKLPYSTVMGRLRFLINHSFAQQNMPLGMTSNRCGFILAKNDKLLSYQQQKNFAETLEIKNIFELSAPHFTAQTHPYDVAKIIKEI